MKTWKNYTYKLLLVFLFTLLKGTAFSQNATGRVVINEYMPWTSNGCGTTAEFIELMNYGPGPINIGCYILTEGDFSITIPPNTILKPGEFYVVSGQNSIPKPCANIDSTIMVNLNWNTCGCTSAPIPSTGDGLFTDGGAASEQLVLLDPNLNVVDAVVRDYPLESSSTITSANVGGGCGSKTFNINTMSINYEVLGMSAGRGNSFARKLDGDCGWVKDPQQSAHATNNTPGATSDIAYDFSIVNAMDCTGDRGSIEVFVKHSNYAIVFPMTYTIVHDANNDGLFDFSDTYTYGFDDSPPSIYIDGFRVGRYRLTVGSVKGCYLQTFDFTILPCYALLPVRLLSFKLDKTTPQTHLFNWVLGDVENVKSLVLEKSTDGNRFVPDRLIPGSGSGTKEFTVNTENAGNYRYYRLKFVAKNGAVGYSSIINTSVTVTFATDHLWPNPASDKINILITSSQNQKAGYSINGINSVAKTGAFDLQPGHNNFTLPIAGLPKGVYQILIVKKEQPNQPLSFRFVKQ